MPDADHFFGEDLSVSASGDIALVDGDDLTTQRIIRRLSTAVHGYLFHLDYGAGLPQRIGDILDIDLISGVIRTQIRLEASVAKIPAPEITITEIEDGVSVYIKFYSAITGQQTSLSFDTTS